MPEEIELKLALPPTSLHRLSNNPLFENLKIAPSIRKELVSTYFDTQDHVLRKAGLSLRIRRDGSKFIQTIKGKRASDSLIMMRDEWEFPVDKQDKPDFSIAGDTALAPFITTSDMQAAIQPLFTVHVDRKVVLLKYSDSEIEIALDDGVVLIQNAEHRFAEVELELKQGNSADLYALACDIAAIVTVRPSTCTKADRGFNLINSMPLEITKSAPISLASGTSTGEAFRSIARACMKHFLANEELLRHEHLAEAVHQARVGLRRLRAAISVFRSAIDDSQRALVSAELRWIASSLGDARDIDVYISNVLEPARNQHEGDQAFDDLLENYKIQRKDAYDRALRALISRRCAKAIMQAITWIETGIWTQSSNNQLSNIRDQPIEKFANEQLARRRKKILKRGRHIGKLKPEERHELRIALKKLRYASEFFASLNNNDKTNKRAKKAISVMSKLQDLLGELNDIAESKNRNSLTEAEKILRDEHCQQEASLIKETRKTFRKFTDLAPFWNG